MFKEFKAFILRGNVIDLAIGVIMGGAFNAVVKSLVDDIIMPPIGLLLGRVDFADLSVTIKAGDSAVAISYGVFINTLITLILTGLAVFLIVKAINRMHRQEEAAPPPAPTTKECPYCLSSIPIGATRCPHCTSQLEAG